MLSYFGEYEKCAKVITDSPIDEVWNEIVRYSDVSYLSQKWKDQNSENYIYVSTSIKQSYEYFKASKTMSMKTRPLLLYYCFLNLTKATLFLLTDNRPKDYHGLCNEDIAKGIKKSSDILNFSAEVNNGVFTELAKYFKWDAPKKQRITLDEFCCNAIEMTNTYFEYFQKPKNFIFPDINGYTNGELEIIFNGRVLDTLEINRESIMNKFKVEDGFALMDDSNDLKFNYLIKHSTKGFEEFKKMASKLISERMSFSVFNDGRYYFNISPDNKKIPNANAYFGIMYILSSIVRYKPEHIYSIIDNKDTSVLWFLSRICDISERVYPNLMINALYGINVKYSASNI